MPSSARPAGFRGTWRADLDARAVYSEAAGIGRIVPAAVAIPEDADDVVVLVKWAAATRTPLVPRGAGSSMGGGAIGEGVIVDLGRLDVIGPVDVERLSVRVGPGALCSGVNALASAYGLHFPVDPSSAAWATIGGMTATNAAGAHSMSLGAMRQWVTAIDCVFADGTRAEVRRTGREVRLLGASSAPAVPAIRRVVDDLARATRGAGRDLVHRGVRKESSGYALARWEGGDDVVDLLVGSEGTLAIFVGIELALMEELTDTASLLAAFPTLEQAVAATVVARQAEATACELLDRTFLDVAAEGATVEVPADTECVLLIEIARPAHHAERAADEARRMEGALVAAGASLVRLGLDPETEQALWTLRHAASPILSRLDPSLASMQFIEDGAVPPDRLPEYVRGVRAALARQGTRGVIFGHAGDAHVHVNPLVDTSMPGWRDRVDALLDEVVELTARLGGTLAGEHGDGRLRAPLLARTWSATALALFARVKHAFDPDGILNPGVKIARDGQSPIGDVKYDPALPPLPAAARAALRRVERERAYAIPRLRLLDGSA